MALDLEGPRLPPASGMPPRKLVIFLHGYGADGNDLIQIGRQWSKVMPDAAFIAPHAPEPCAMAGAGGGRQWFDLTFRDPDEYWRGVSRAGPGLERFVDRERERYGLASADVALVGFSQGTMMALHVGLRRQDAFGALVGFSGALAGGERLAEDLAGKPPVLLVHGDRDEVIPIHALFLALQTMSACELPVEFHISHGIGHGIDPEGIRIGGHFVAASLSSKRL